MSTLEPGMLVAGYRLERLLGQGGMGVVYEATQLSLERTVALKIVAPGLAVDKAFRTRFRREGLAQARLDHPNIVTVYEAGEFEGVLFLAMRLIRGPSLKEMIISRELDAERALHILGSVADALDSAHEVGLIHRDVKPHNILVGPRDHPYLADFGLTKGPEDTGLTRTGQFMGSLDYISPEQIRGEAATSASDIYSLGAVLFECLAGVVPYPKESDAAVLYAHVAEDPPHVSHLRPALPGGLDTVLARAMAKEPLERPTTATELVREAERVFGEQTLKTMKPPEPVESPTELGIRPAEGAVDTVQSRATVADQLARTVGAQQREPTVRAVDVDAPAVVDTPPAPSSPARRRPWLRADVLGVTAAIAVLAGGGFAIGHSGKHARSVPSRVAKEGPVELTVPAAWGAPAQAPSIPGLSLAGGMAAEDRSSGGVMFAGRLPSAGGAKLLPAAFTALLQRPPSAGDPVRLAGASAYRYRSLSVRGLAGPLTLLVAPTEAGVVAVGCLEPSGGARAFLASCEGVAATLKLVGARALPLGPEPAYGESLAKAVAGLRAGKSSSDALAAARTRARQAALAASLAGVQAAAAATLAGARPGPDAAALNGRLVAEFRAAAAGYNAMARAAGAGNTKAYDSARAGTARELSAASQTISALRATGYGA